MVFVEKLYAEGHEEVIFCSDPSCGLKAIIAIHDTTLGPALGGTRMWMYNEKDDAVNDALRLSRAMTYKASVAGLDLGGGKGVIMGDPCKDKSEALLRSYGRFIESLDGRFITAEDVNITVRDIEDIYKETNSVAGVDQMHGGSGDPAPFTARGVFKGMEACCLKVFGERSLKNKTVLLQGVGAVGYFLAQHLTEMGSHIIFTDIVKEKIAVFQEAIPGAEFVEEENIYDVKCDIYAPCALGATINDDTIDRLKCKIIAGAANNQLAEQRHGDILRSKNILYAPDFVINAGGLMNVSLEHSGWSEKKILKLIQTIYDTTMKILKISEKEEIATCRVANYLAEERIRSIRNMKGKYFQKNVSDSSHSRTESH